MPAGWRPRGLPKKVLTEITQENQTKFRTPMFANAKLYLVIQCAIAFALMAMVIRANSEWTVTERWLGAALLWWQLINIGGILEAKNWVLISEATRILATVFAVIIFSELYAPSLATISIVAIAFVSLLWTLTSFRASGFVTQQT
jgi:hypothetical protein